MFEPIAFTPEEKVTALTHICACVIGGIGNGRPCTCPVYPGAGTACQLGSPN